MLQNSIDYQLGGGTIQDRILLDGRIMFIHSLFPFDGRVGTVKWWRRRNQPFQLINLLKYNGDVEANTKHC